MSLEKTRRLNVLALSYLFPNRSQPGYGIFVMNRLRAVSSLCNVKVIAPVPWYPLLQRLRPSLWKGNVPSNDTIGGLKVFHPRFPVIPRYMKWFDSLSYWWAARRVARQLLADEGYEFDVVDVHWTYPDIVAGHRLARSRRKKFIITVRGHEALYDQEWSIRRWLVAHFLRRADFVVTLSAELRDKVVALGVRPERVGVVLNGVDLDSFRHLDRDASRAALGLPKDQKILLSVGRLTEGKGHHELVRILPELSKRQDVALYIIGGVNPEDDFSHVLLRMIADLGLSNVHIVDRVTHDKLACWYAAADVFCLATQREGCPNVVLEALACGTPVVVTNVGAVDEIIEPGSNGFLVDPRQLSTLGPTVQEALSRTWDRQAIAARMEDWGWSACARQVMDVYRAIVT
jgi:glycosyltransferase involved in cell wall biosynthesis